MKVSIVVLNLTGVLVLATSIAVWADCGPPLATSCTDEWSCKINGPECWDSDNIVPAGGCDGSDNYTCGSNGTAEVQCSVTGNVCTPQESGGTICAAAFSGGGSTPSLPTYAENQQSPCVSGG